ncbi:hypothetical protein GPEL0_02f0074 [Geoanaerobacter pelophilus]|uniref:Uncharacterized protein n=1 Tax=Geoanaerobacter pelophilus TaxID=60036 RepID=A0ABQ0MPS1_9BACT|nr:hypothetical protein GPEL0_02f0074 [Geoanaerobacter pelophilus]
MSISFFPGVIFFPTDKVHPHIFARRAPEAIQEKKHYIGHFPPRNNNCGSLARIVP